MQSDTPKQFIELAGKPILMRTMEVFFQFDPDIRMILVLPADQRSFWQVLCEKHGFSIDYQIVDGGANRFESVKNGLKEAPDTGLIGVHDGVRPFVRPDFIRSVYDKAAQNGNAVPALDPSETVRVEEGDHNYQIDRAKVRLIQTPQVFDAAKLKAAYQCDYNPAFTDDASVYEAAGHRIYLVDGQVGNSKITTPFDLPPTPSNVEGE